MVIRNSAGTLERVRAPKTKPSKNGLRGLESVGHFDNTSGVKRVHL